MYDKYQIERCDAMEWLAENYPEFPETMPDVAMSADWCSERLFANWRFVLLDDGSLSFANCLSPCIKAEDMAGFAFITF